MQADASSTESRSSTDARSTASESLESPWGVGWTLPSESSLDCLSKLDAEAHGEGLSPGATAGVVVGVLLALALLAALTYYLCYANAHRPEASRVDAQTHKGAVECIRAVNARAGTLSGAPLVVGGRASTFAEVRPVACNTSL